MTVKHIILVVFAFLTTVSCFAGGGETDAQFSISASSIVVDRTVTFTDASTSNGSCGPINSWFWDFGPGASPATANTQGPHTVTYTSTGTKSIRLDVGADGPGCRSDFIMNVLEVTQVPIPTMSQWSLLICGLLITTIAVGRIWLAVKNPA